MLAIKNNIMAGNAARHLGKAYDSLATSVERLASGLRINSAKDDAAGLAVRELIRADVAVLKQGARNAQDGISMLQSMEGAMAVMDDNLIRMKELAEQAATGSYSNDQRTIMNAEFAEMAEEIDRIAASTAFNGNALLSSGADDVTIHVGTTDTIAINAKDMTTGTSGLNIATGSGGFQSISDHGVQNVDDDWITFVGDTGGTDSAGTEQNLVITFTDADGTDETSVTVNLALENVGNAADTSYTLEEVVELINAQSLNLAVAGDGTVQAYEMASIEHDNDTGLNYLKLSSRSADMDGVTIEFTTQDHHDSTLGIALAKATSAGDITEASGANSTDDGAMVDTAGTGLSIATASSALTALSRITAAITTKDAARAEFGYKMNRLESTISILDIQAENLMSAESRISDVDVATEMAALTRTQVLSQAGISMLAQANQMPQMALSLLR
jgi:flagellin